MPSYPNLQDDGSLRQERSSERVDPDGGHGVVRLHSQRGQRGGAGLESNTSCEPLNEPSIANKLNAFITAELVR